MTKDISINNISFTNSRVILALNRCDIYGLLDSCMFTHCIIQIDFKNWNGKDTHFFGMMCHFFSLRKNE